MMTPLSQSRFCNVPISIRSTLDRPLCPSVPLVHFPVIGIDRLIDRSLGITSDPTTTIDRGLRRLHSKIPHDPGSTERLRFLSTLSTQRSCKTITQMSLWPRVHPDPMRFPFLTKKGICCTTRPTTGISLWLWCWRSYTEYLACYQSHCLKPYINLHRLHENKREESIKIVLYKLMNNSVLGRQWGTSRLACSALRTRRLAG